MEKLIYVRDETREIYMNMLTGQGAINYNKIDEVDLIDQPLNTLFSLSENDCIKLIIREEDVCTLHLMRSYHYDVDLTVLDNVKKLELIYASGPYTYRPQSYSHDQNHVLNLLYPSPPPIFVKVKTDDNEWQFRLEKLSSLLLIKEKRK